MTCNSDAAIWGRYDFNSKLCYISYWFYSLDVGLVQGNKASMDGQCYGSQVEVVKKDGQVIVKTSGGGEVELQCSTRDTWDGTVLVWTKCLIRKPQLYH